MSNPTEDDTSCKPIIAALPEREPRWETLRHRLRALLRSEPLYDPATPPGPPPGEPAGEESFLTSLSFDALFDGLEVSCRFQYHYDPACCLSVLIYTEEGYLLYSFETRAYSFQHALAHVARSNRHMRIAIPVAGLHPRARWQSANRTCDVVSLPGMPDIHPLALVPDQQKQ